MDAKNYPAAESDYREAIRLKPGYAEAHCYLGVALGKQGKTEEAEKEFREAIRCKPDDGKALKNLAIVLDKRGERKEARGYWERALKGEKRPEIAEWIKHRLAEPD